MSINGQTTEEIESDISSNVPGSYLQRILVHMYTGNQPPYPHTALHAGMDY